LVGGVKEEILTKENIALYDENSNVDSNYEITATAKDDYGYVTKFDVVVPNSLTQKTCKLAITLGNERKECYIKKGYVFSVDTKAYDENNVKINSLTNQKSVCFDTTVEGVEGTKCTIIAAIYDEEGKLYGIAGKGDVEVKDGKATFKTSEKLLPETGCTGWQFKTFVWNGINNMVSLAKPDVQGDYSKSFKVLAIGNSFSQDATEYLYHIAESYGIKEIKIGNLYIGGCSLETHWNNADYDREDYTYYKNTTGTFQKSTSSIKSALSEEDWDIIVMQQVSGLSGVESSYQPYLNNLIDYINENKTNPYAKIAWHMTWAYQADSNHGDFARYENNQETMYNAIVSAVENIVVPEQDVDYIIPSGTAVQNVRTSYIGDALTRDGYHLTIPYGRYVAGLTWFKALTEFSIENVEFAPSEINEGYVQIAKEAVNNAFETPFEITNSVYTEI